MFASMRLHRRPNSWAWRVATAIALLAQCWVAAASLADARGLGASAHVEASGTSKHFGHDEATCAACILLALHAPPAAPPGSDLAVTVARSSVVVAPATFTPVAEPPSNPSRAPPSDC